MQDQSDPYLTFSPSPLASTIHYLTVSQSMVRGQPYPQTISGSPRGQNSYPNNNVIFPHLLI